MEKWLYGYWFKAKKKTVGWGWTIIPTTLQGLVVWIVAIVSCILLGFPEMISSQPKHEVMLVAGATFAIAAVITFVKTKFNE